MEAFVLEVEDNISGVEWVDIELVAPMEMLLETQSRAALIVCSFQNKCVSHSTVTVYRSSSNSIVIAVGILAFNVVSWEKNSSRSLYFTTVDEEAAKKQWKGWGSYAECASRLLLVLHDEIDTGLLIGCLPAQVNRAVRVMTNMTVALKDGSKAFGSSIKEGGEYLEASLHETGKTLAEKVEAPKEEITVRPSVSSAALSVRNATPAVVSFAQKAEATVEGAGRWIGEGVRSVLYNGSAEQSALSVDGGDAEQQEQLLSKEETNAVDVDDNDDEEKVEVFGEEKHPTALKAATQLGAAAVLGAVNVLDGLWQATASVASGVGEATVTVVEKKFGENVGTAARDGLEGTRDIGRAFMSTRFFSKFAKGAATGISDEGAPGSGEDEEEVVESEKDAEEAKEEGNLQPVGEKDAKIEMGYEHENGKDHVQLPLAEDPPTSTSPEIAQEGPEMLHDEEIPQTEVVYSIE